MPSRIEQEKQTVERMVRLYCRKKEGNKQLCPQCEELLGYARTRLWQDYVHQYFTKRFGVPRQEQHKQ